MWSCAIQSGGIRRHCLCQQKDSEMVAQRGCRNIIIIIIIIVITAIELSLGDSSPYTSTDKTNNNKYT